MTTIFGFKHPALSVISQARNYNAIVSEVDLGDDFKRKLNSIRRQYKEK